MKDEKLKRLENVARMYYEQNMTQAQIAKEIRVSRPMVSRLLDEARDAGIVEIRIHTKSLGDNLLLDSIKQQYNLRGGYIVPNESDDISANNAISSAALKLIEELGGGRLGIGWGHIIGCMVAMLENRPPQKTSITHVCPMVGNSSVSIRHYHSNENARILAQQTLAKAHYLHTPAFADTRQELESLKQIEQYKSILREWERLDIALVNIGNHPSTPDFASGARFGNLLVQKRAVGRLIAYYFNMNGEVIFSDHDYVIQIPIECLVKSKHIVGVCSANVNARALTGALQTGLFTHIVVQESLIREVLG